MDPEKSKFSALCLQSIVSWLTIVIGFIKLVNEMMTIAFKLVVSSTQYILPLDVDKAVSVIPWKMTHINIIRV
jgi:hypothetical protein